VAAHIRRGDVGDARHFRYVSTHRWSVGLLSVAEAALRESAASASPQLRIFVLVVTELPWGPAQRANISRPLAALNRTARGAGRIYYAERVGGDPLEAFAHLAAADVRVLVQTTERIYSLINVLTRSRAYLLTLQVLAASDSHFSIAAAQLSLGVHLRIRRQGFAAADVQHMVPLPLMGSDAEARARVRVNRNRGCAEDGQHAQRGPARSSVRGRPQLQRLHPLAQGRPLGPRREASQLASPRGCRTEAAAALWRLAKVAHSLCCLRPSRTRQCWRLAAAPSSAAACEATSSGEPTWLSSYPPRVRGGSTARAVWSSASCERACRFPLRTMDVSQSAIFILDQYLESSRSYQILARLTPKASPSQIWVFNAKDETSLQECLEIARKIARNCSKSLEKCLENPLLSSSCVMFLP